jgi:hypothetical protein
MAWERAFRGGDSVHRPQIKSQPLGYFFGGQ